MGLGIANRIFKGNRHMHLLSLVVKCHGKLRDDRFRVITYGRMKRNISGLVENSIAKIIVLWGRNDVTIECEHISLSDISKQKELERTQSTHLVHNGAILGIW